MQHLAAVEVDARVDQREAVADLAGVTVPEHDRVVGTGHPLPVLAVDVDRGVEGVRELYHAAVEVRVADGDRAHAAELGYRGDQVVVDVGDHVPEDVSRRGAHQQRALPDRGRRLGADANHAGTFGLDLALVASVAELGQARPLLPIPAHVLALVFADRAVLARGRVLDAAGAADRQIGLHALPIPDVEQGLVT